MKQAASRLIAFVALMAGPQALADETAFYDPEPDKPWTSYILFHRKVFTDTGEYLQVIGGWTGKGLGYPNNSVTIQCRKTNMVCIIATSNQIGNNHVGDILLHEREVTHWTPSIITVIFKDICVTQNITLNRRSKEVTYLTTPVGSSSSGCSKSDGNTYVWHLTDPLGILKMDKAIK
jgi:hypothetical protein